MTHVPASEEIEQTTWTEPVSVIELMPRWLGIILILLVLVTSWQIVHISGIVSPIILPSPMETAEDIAFVGDNLFSGGYMLAALWVTIKEVVLGFAIAIAIGFTLGIIVGESTFGERSVLPLLVAIDTMPKVAFAPLFLAWLGFGIASKVALAAFIATFPIVVATAAGIHAADENAKMLFKTMGASRWQTLFKMKLLVGLPQLFTGLKIAAVGVMAGAITGEFIGGGKGFGELIRVAASQLNTPRVFALILYLSVLGLALFWAVVWAERKIVFWHRTSASTRGRYS
jgi:NitT/TauT family transport system permease protein